MRQERNNIFAEIDWILVFLFATLVGFGWMNIYAASKTEETVDLISFSTKYGKQLIFICLTIPIIIIILFFNAKFYEKFSSIFYLISPNKINLIIKRLTVVSIIIRLVKLFLLLVYTLS